jgi:hypothetical protein
MLIWTNEDPMERAQSLLIEAQGKVRGIRAAAQVWQRRYESLRLAFIASVILNAACFMALLWMVWHA